MSIHAIRDQDLSEAVAADQFDLLYQPVIELRTRRIKKAEGLIRWRHPERGVLGPDVFIAQAERSGQIGAVGAWVLRRAIRDLGSLRASHPDFEVSVNVSPVQIESERWNEAVLSEALQAQDVAASCLILEITEGVALGNDDATRQKMARLRATGVKLAIDDFGMGHSALTSLIHFPCDFIKLDRLFVRDASQDRTRHAIAKLIVDLAHTLGLQVIAEGVETEGDLAHVVSLGCDHAQGYYWSAPLPFEKLRAALTS